MELQNLVDGRWADGKGEEFTSTNPSRPSDVVAVGALAGPAEVDEAVAAARRAQPDWARTPHHERAAILSRAAALIDASADAWGHELAAEEGKTRAEGVGEAQRAAQILRYYAAEADHETGQLYASPRRGEQILVTRRALGVVGIITPFNFPIAIPAWKIAPALSYGNAVVWKPASIVPLLAMRFAQALHDAGVPPGVVNMVVADGPTGGHLVDHPGIHAVSFTGSTAVGQAIAASCAARGVPVQAEMGGKNPAIVLDDADLDLAVDQVLLGAYRATGQKCTATSRLILQDGIAEPFLAAFARRASELVVGDAVAPGVQMGPLVSAAARDEVQRGIDTAVRQGARVLAGGSPYGGALADGWFVPPTVLDLPSTTLDVWRDELFGPVVGVVRARTAAEAFALANDSAFGLSASVFTTDLGRALESVDALDVGQLHVNSESAGADPHVPFGGAKRSGYGPKEQGRAARDFYTHTTTVYLRG
ncbi:aldehyde dehydrogenase family protein [Cryptosporangium aurantiacum]|uniref:Aldehyde dehydrogenase (NAD+) n=1 Tax=Cryptosporangium aurantiacum TaxID=134849 RepID=A0A1M7RAP5_9ACTN|nr:aldehyde dehydrogenase family protein [Cryptosporangium aurantiacum]SHN43367.1 aldehyde dehydrogenase (NAD+) [Cryptosporangium aurantiacum]